MDKTDEIFFEEYISSLCEDIDRDDTSQWFCRFEDNAIQYLKCKNKNQKIIIGRISIWTKDKSGSAKKAESTFRKLEKWLKENYTNNLTCRNINIEGSANILKDVWIGSSAKDSLTRGEVELKQSPDSFVAYELA